MFLRRQRVLAVLAATLAVTTFGAASVTVAQEKVTATVEIAEVSISVANPGVNFGTVGLGAIASTKNGAIAPTVTNTGNVTLGQLVVGYDYGIAASGAKAFCATTGSWTALSAPPPGLNTFFMSAYTWVPGSAGVVIPITQGTGVNVLGGGGGTTLAAGATFDIDLDFAVPTAITTEGRCAADLEVIGIAAIAAS